MLVLRQCCHDDAHAGSMSSLPSVPALTLACARSGPEQAQARGRDGGPGSFRRSCRAQPARLCQRRHCGQCSPLGHAPMRQDLTCPSPEPAMALTQAQGSPSVACGQPQADLVMAALQPACCPGLPQITNSRAWAQVTMWRGRLRWPGPQWPRMQRTSSWTTWMRSRQLRQLQQRLQRTTSSCRPTLCRCAAALCCSGPTTSQWHGCCSCQ